jgi:hypothetical protein
MAAEPLQHKGDVLKAFNAQVVPIVGPVVVSPLAAVANLVCLVSGGAMALIGNAKKSLGYETKLAERGMLQLESAGINLVFSIFNTLSVGLLGAGIYLVGRASKAAAH